MNLLMMTSRPLPPVINSPAKPRFGQLFIGDEGKTIVLEPKEPTERGAILYQQGSGQPIAKIGSSPVVESWTRVTEAYGPLFNKGSDGFYALVSHIKQSLLMGPKSPLRNLPAAEQKNAFTTVVFGKPSPFNGGVKLEYPQAN